MKLIKRILLAAQTLEEFGHIHYANQLDDMASRLERRAALDLRQPLYLFRTALVNLTEFVEAQLKSELARSTNKIFPNDRVAKVMSTCKAFRDAIPQTEDTVSLRNYVDHYCNNALMMEGKRIEQLVPYLKVLNSQIGPIQRAVSALAVPPSEEITFEEDADNSASPAFDWSKVQSK